MWLSHLLADKLDGIGGSLQSAEENENSQVIILVTHCKIG
jgi:hypothetical protein